MYVHGVVAGTSREPKTVFMVVGRLLRRPDDGWLLGGGEVRLVNTEAKVVSGQTRRVSTRSRALEKLSFSVVFITTTTFSNIYLSQFLDDVG